MQRRNLILTKFRYLTMNYLHFIYKIENSIQIREKFFLKLIILKFHSELNKVFKIKLYFCK